jgi:Tol biopolymer transport system component
VEFDQVQLWVANADGSRAAQLGGMTFADPTSFAWSPEGDLIAVVHESTRGGHELVLVPTDGGSPRTILPELDVDAVAWRPPDGAQLVVRAKNAARVEPLVLSLVNRDGTGLTALDLDPGYTRDAYYSLNIAYYFMSPAWSPDGSRLAFHTLEDVFGPGDPDPGWRVHVASVSPSGEVSGETTFNADPSIDDEFNPQWLPDGSGLVVNRLEEGVSSLEIQPLTGAPTGVDLGLAKDEGGPTLLVSPDGSLVLAWMAPGDAGGPARAWSVDPSTGTPTPVDLPVDDWVSWQRLAK